MRNKVSFIAGAMTVIFAIALVNVAFASYESLKKDLYYKDIQVTLNGKKLDLRGAAEPFIIDGTTYLPVRAISEALGMNVEWESETNTVILTGVEYSKVRIIDASELIIKTNYGTVLQKDPASGYADCTVRIGGDAVALNVCDASGNGLVALWQSDNDSVVTISPDGNLVPIRAGTAHVTAMVGNVMIGNTVRFGGASVTCIIRVR